MPMTPRSFFRPSFRPSLSSAPFFSICLLLFSYPSFAPSLPPSLPHLDMEEGALGASRAGGGVEVEADATAGLQVPGHALEARGLGWEGRRGGREGGEEMMSVGMDHTL